MQPAALAGDRRVALLIGSGLVAAAGVGLLAGRAPVLALSLTLAAALAAAMLQSLALAAALFTLASFADVISIGGAATGVKAVGALLVLAWIASSARRPGAEARSLAREHRWLVGCAAGLVVWSMLSAAWAQSPATALSGATRYAMDIALFPILYGAVTGVRDARWITAAFIAGALGSTLYGVVTGSISDGSRLSGAAGDPNETAAILVATAALAIGLGLGERRGLRRLLAFAGAALALLGLVATASRGGAISLAVTALAAVAIAGRWRRQVALAAACAAVVVVGWFAVIAPASSRNHITSTESGRTTLWTVAGRAIAANPVVGLGNDNFRLAAKNYLIQPGVTTDAFQVVSDPKVAHNIYLELWADLGIVGLALFAGLATLSVRAAWAAARLQQHAGRHGGELLARSLVLAIVAILAADLFLSDLYSKQLFLLLALAPALLGATRRELGHTRS